MTGLFRLAPLLLIILTFSPAAAVSAELSGGQTVYVPCYTHIYHGVKKNLFYLAVTLSVRNVDPQASFTLTGVDFYDTEGKMIKSYLGKPELMTPLMTREFVIQENETKGGSGANFIVRWKADKPLNPPLIEAVMIGTYYNQGISFLSRGVELK